MNEYFTKLFRDSNVEKDEIYLIQRYETHHFFIFES